MEDYPPPTSDSDVLSSRAVWRKNTSERQAPQLKRVVFLKNTSEGESHAATRLHQQRPTTSADVVVVTTLTTFDIVQYVHFFLLVRFLLSCYIKQTMKKALQQACSALEKSRTIRTTSKLYLMYHICFPSASPPQVNLNVEEKKHAGLIIFCCYNFQLRPPVEVRLPGPFCSSPPVSVFYTWGRRRTPAVPRRRRSFSACASTYALQKYRTSMMNCITNFPKNKNAICRAISGRKLDLSCISAISTSTILLHRIQFLFQQVVDRQVQKLVDVHPLRDLFEHRVILEDVNCKSAWGWKIPRFIMQFFQAPPSLECRA